MGGALGVLLWARWRGYVGLELLDLASVPLALGYAIGRVGCQLSGDGDYGGPSDLPWAMGYPNGTVPTDPGVTVHPSPIYETLTMGLIALGLWNLRDRMRPGQLFGLYLVLAGLERFLVEFVRRNDALLAGLTLPQLVSVGLMLLGALMVARVGRNGPLPA